MGKFESGCLYLFVFGITVLLCIRADQVENFNVSGWKTRRKFLVFLAIMLPCVLAALRADEVGVDTVSVGKVIQLAHSYSSYSNMSVGSGMGQYEFGYASLAYIISRFTDQPGMMLFALQALTIIPVMKVAIILKNKISLASVISVYLFCFYNNSFNIMRQSVACAFILLGTVLYWVHSEDENITGLQLYISTIVCYIVAILFHKSSFIGIAVIFLLVVISKLHISGVLQTFLYVVVCLLPTMFQSLASILTRLGLMNSSFTYYYDVFIGKTIETNKMVDPFSLYCTVDVVLRLCLLLIPCLFSIRKQHVDYSESQAVMQRISITGFLTFAVILYAMSTNYGQRLSMFFDFFLITFIPLSIVRPNYRLKKTIVFILLLSYWLIWIIKFGWSGSEFYSFRL